MRLALAQLNPIVGDLAGNAKGILAACQEASLLRADLVLTPELSLWGYPPRDLLLDQMLLDQQEEILAELARNLSNKTPKLSLLIGIAEKANDSDLPQLFNSIALVKGNKWNIVARKQLLPTYDVFDERRYFRPTTSPSILNLSIDDQSWELGLTICEDLWVDETIQGRKLTGPNPISSLSKYNLDILINFSASPFNQGKEAVRQSLAERASKKLNCPVIYLNQVGANDELVFDGASFVLNKEGIVSLKLPSCRSALAIWDTSLEMTTKTNTYNLVPSEESLFKALVLGLRDYVNKCGLQSVLVGLSGGIDSSLVVVIAVAALGSEKTTGILMPSPWSSPGSINDASELAKKLGVNTHTLPISKLMHCFDSTLTEPLGKPPNGIAAENLQSRIRGTLLMAMANQQGHLLLSTGNKSELAVGYCTLYGDMNGGLAVIGDLYKTHVYQLCKWLNSPESKQCRNEMGLPSSGIIIEEAILKKPPSAELRPGQLDTDTLPDYASLDPILKGLIEDRKTTKELIKNGYNPDLIIKVQQLLRKSEFKRRQAPPLLKVSHQAFGSGWRIPIASL